MNDGGPAFPHEVETADGGITTRFHGMSLRDYFAAQALNASSFVWRNVLTEEDVARNAYRVADAMLKERERKQ